MKKSLNKHESTKPSATGTAGLEERTIKIHAALIINYQQVRRNDWSRLFISIFNVIHTNHSWALLYRDTYILVLKVSEHAGTSKYHDNCIGAPSTCFL